jgi:hypothetical protein
MGGGWREAGGRCGPISEQERQVTESCYGVDDAGNRVYNFHIIQFEKHAVGICGVLVHNSNLDSHPVPARGLQTPAPPNSPTSGPRGPQTPAAPNSPTSGPRGPQAPAAPNTSGLSRGPGTAESLPPSRPLRIYKPPASGSDSGPPAPPPRGFPRAYDAHRPLAGLTPREIYESPEFEEFLRNLPPEPPPPGFPRIFRPDE